jgi:3-oxo-5alpha-steroid 4-dehydrogenase
MAGKVVIVGFGAAGACAAIAAATAGAEVTIVDRFGGGGATELSGGVVYAGGGTPFQRSAGVTDTPARMHAYLRTEVGDAVPDAVLTEFCEQSVAMLDWLAGLGVPFDASLCPYKTSYPTNRHYLYYSGSELARADVAAPAPRGHRTKGRGTSGKVLYRALRAAVLRQGVVFLPQTTARSVVVDEAGAVTGVACTTIGPRWARLAHHVLHRWSRKPYLYAPGLGRMLHRPVAWLELRSTELVVLPGSVVIAAGGFAANHDMLRAHAPRSRGTLPLATPGDDGAGIALGVAAGAATARLDNVSIWRFVTPPPALTEAVLVDETGKPIGDLARYGAVTGAVVAAHAGRAWLLLDDATVRKARREVRGTTLWFQRLQAWYLLFPARRSAATAEALAAKAGLDPAGLASTAGALGDPPYSLIDVSIRPRPFYPAPVLTLGGLVTDPATGQVLRADGTAIPGLYAAGRSAVGICSGSYVSGLSLADCVFSGRRSGASAAGSLCDLSVVKLNGLGDRWHRYGLLAHLRRPPVPPAQQHDGRGYEQRADKERVHQHAEGEAGADVAELRVALLRADDREHRERAAEHQAGRGDRGTGRDQGAADRLVQRMLLRLFPDPAHHQDVVVLAERQQEDEHQERQEEHQPAVAGDLDEDEHRQA